MVIISRRAVVGLAVEWDAASSMHLVALVKWACHLAHVGLVAEGEASGLGHCGRGGWEGRGTNGRVALGVI